MSITSKEIAKGLGLSPSAVSLALNNKPGVSSETRELVLAYAEKHGYEFKRKYNGSNKLNIIFIIYQEFPVALDYHIISVEMLDGITEMCQKNNCKLNTIKINPNDNSLDDCIADIRLNPVDGILLLGTSISEKIVKQFTNLKIPMVLLDCPLDCVDCSRVSINNVQGSYAATNYLIQMRKKQPGYLASSIRLNNFIDREIGFKKALEDNGLSYSQSIIQKISPSIDGAFADFMSILESGGPIADCYFADNDLLAIGTMKALLAKGYRIPEDVGIVGFDNIEFCHLLNPSLSSIAFSRKFIGQISTDILIQKISNNKQPNVKLQVDTRLVKRCSV
ncbi:LacI family DNA-binding transcriptional regulator [Pseudobutyrivibrio sp.]|uniref:LacI family DNA-binding transcriptional regulator n=1 Tax=Pseudobutyrivibrio sp. TaxID=2014367 RepID=UPI001D8E483E|nr:LacI family DNA-binding transcriptional regulator [Pseudobutyrivibrio sp.]MBE5909919.1 LacI family transcriptional regulator [Pseudobutyrivibrio sp.]